MTATLPRHVERVMGTAVSIDVRGPLAPAALHDAVAYLHWAEATFSTYRHDTEISKIASGALDLDDSHVEVRRVMAQCEELRAATEGWFDHRPFHNGAERLDPSGLVKGWAIDRCAERLRDAGAASLSINAGGDVRTLGRPPQRNGWRVGIRHPAHLDRVAAVVTITDEAVATSGAYERGRHVWYAPVASTVASVTVVGPELAVADALATALFACGTIDPPWMGRFGDYSALWIDTAGCVHHAPELEVDRLGAGA